MFKNLINKIKRQFQNNYLIYFILMLCMIIGIIVGSFVVIKYKQSEGLKLIAYFNWVFKYLNNEIYGSINIFKFSFFSNIKIIIFIWLIGLIGLGVFIIPIIICLKGVSIGFTVGCLVNSFGFKGFLFSCFGLFPYYLLAMPTFLLMAGISTFNSIFKNKFKKNNILKSKQFVDYSFVLLLVSIFILLNALIEGFFSFNLLRIIKIGF